MQARHDTLRRCAERRRRVSSFLTRLAVDAWLGDQGLPVREPTPSLLKNIELRGAHVMYCRDLLVRILPPFTTATQNISPFLPRRHRVPSALTHGLDPPSAFARVAHRLNRARHSQHNAHAAHHRPIYLSPGASLLIYPATRKIYEIIPATARTHLRNKRRRRCRTHHGCRFTTSVAAEYGRAEAHERHDTPKPQLQSAQHEQQAGRRKQELRRGEQQDGCQSWYVAMRRPVPKQTCRVLTTLQLSACALHSSLATRASN